MKKKSTPSRKSANKSNRPVNTVALKGTVSKSRRRAELQHIPWNSITLETLNPQLGRKLIVGKDIMLARVFLKKGCVVPEHSHPNEQLTYILEGALKFWIDGAAGAASGGLCRSSLLRGGSGRRRGHVAERFFQLSYDRRFHGRRCDFTELTKDP